MGGFMKNTAYIPVLLWSIFVFFSWSCSKYDVINNDVSIKGGTAPNEIGSQSKASAIHQNTDNGVSASSLKLKVFKIGFSTEGDCSNPEVFSLAGEYVDFIGSPNLGQGSLPEADYRCVMIEMSDHIKFTPAENFGAHCVEGQEEVQDVCTAPNIAAGQFPRHTLLDGTEQEPCDDQENRVVMHLSVESKQDAFYDSNRNAISGFIYPPRETDPQIIGNGQEMYGGFYLLASFLVESTRSVGVFYMDVENKVVSLEEDEVSKCSLDVPRFGFYKE